MQTRPPTPPTTSGSPSCSASRSASRSPVDNCHHDASSSLFQAALFYLPYRVWCALEGGVLSSFGTDGKTPVWESHFLKEGVLKVMMIGDDQ